MITLDLAMLSDEQIIAWYSRHPIPTVRAIVQRLADMKERHKGELVQAYQDGFQSGLKPDMGLSPEELRLSTIYARAE
jgi:hypothetical protein